MILPLGILGGLALVAGAAWPVHPVTHPTKSVKNWLLALGGFLMLIFASLDYYFNQAPFFFILLQLLVNFASILMMCDTDDHLDTILLSLAGVGLVLWSLLLFEDFSTIFFILGLLGIGIGYALDTGSLKRNIALLVGSILITIFSYLGAAWIFFWLNLFFAIFSTWNVYLLKAHK